MDFYDVIIIGTGAGGGTLARSLAPSGKRILLLERGDWLPREPANWLAQDVFVDNKYVSPDTWYDEKGKPFQPQVHYFVGGATKLYGAALYRLRPQDFGELRHHDGISPAWPISYDELEPYYTRAEQAYEVHGVRGEDPTEGPASAPYPFPAVSHEPRIQQLADDLEAAGYRPFHAPCGIRLNEPNMPYSACVRCQNCDGFPCAVHGKSDADVLGVRPALEHPNVTLLTNARAVRLETNDAGTAVTGVTVEREGETEQFAGDIVVLACGAANTAALLLSSANDKHPNGLANGSDQVGRNYMFHASEAVLALSREENPTVFQKTLGLNDFYFGTDDHDYPLGNIQMVGKSQAPMFHGEKPTQTKLAPGWTLEKIAKHAIDFWLSTEDLPSVERRSETGALQEVEVDPRRAAHGRRSSVRALRVHEERHHGRRLRPPGRHMPLRDRSGYLSARRRLQGARARQPLRRRHERLPQHRSRQHGPDGDGELAARGRPSARASGSGRAGRGGGGCVSDAGVATELDQIEIAHGEQRAGVVALGGGLRSYEAGGRKLLNGFRPGERPASGRGQVLIPWPNRIAGARYTFGGRDLHLALNDPRTGSAIHGLTRTMAWSVAGSGTDTCTFTLDLHARAGYPFQLGLEAAYTLGSDGLRVRITATNRGDAPCPYGAGAHPYVHIGDGAMIDEALLHVPAGVADQHLPLPQVTAQHHHLLGRPERRRQEAVAVQPLQPLAVEHVALGGAA